MSYVAKMLPASVVSMFLLLVAGATPVQAQFDDGLSDVQGQTELSGDSLPLIIGRILDVALGLLGIIFLVLMLYAGFMWMTAGGNDEKVGTAKKLITQAVIGLILTVAAYAISDFVVDAIGTAV